MLLILIEFEGLSLTESIHKPRPRQPSTPKPHDNIPFSLLDYSVGEQGKEEHVGMPTTT